jgi:uncharacterized protein (TIGR02466 family)|tara:strand:+ start:3926 stop:4504 length:579 start_codon:yes stop_codon:yes gene_type:complete
MSNSNLIKIFGAPIYMAHSLISENEINLLTKECFNLKKQIKKGGENWKSDVYNTLGTYDLRKNKKFNNINKTISSHVNIFAKQLGSNYDYTCSNGWFNFYNKGDYQEYHYHAKSYFSAVFILQNPKPEPKLIFKNPILDMYPLENIEVNEFNAMTFELGMPKNSLVIFRSFLEHMVEKTKTDDQRLSLAYNF